MKMLVKIVVVLVAIVSVAMVAAMFTKKDYTLKREIAINKPSQDVFQYIRYLRNQEAYSKWLSLDPDTKINYKGSVDGTPGAILAFSSRDNKAGTGEWETTSVVENKRINFELRFLEPFTFTANGHMAVDSLSPTQTKLEWVYNSGMKWPMNIMLLFMDMDKIVGNDIAISLGNIKTNLETKWKGETAYSN